MNLTELLGFVDTAQLEYVEESREGINRARLVQGNPEFAKDPTLNQTVRYLGGIGLSAEGLPEAIISRGAIVTINEKDFVTFQSLETVVLASARTRRFYAEVEGNQRLACGSNQDGQNARGWSGVACKQCQYYPKNFEASGGKKQDACRADVTALVYFPELDHLAILGFHGASYMEATGWLSQVSQLCRAFAQRPEVQATSPGLPRVNPYFFKTRLYAGEFEKGENNNQFQRLKFSKVGQPFVWDEKILNSAATLKRIKEAWAELEDAWKQLYVGHNSNAIMSLPAPPVAGSLPAQSSAPEITKEVVTAAPAQPEPTINIQSTPVQSAMQSPAQAIPPVAAAPHVSESRITLDDADEVAHALPPISVPMGF